MEKLKTIEEKNKDFIQAYTEDFWNKQNIAVFEKYFTADFIVHNANGDQNFEQYKGLCKAYFTAFPDLHITTDDQVAEGDKVTKVWTANCTHKGEIMGIPATGNQIVVKGIEVFKIEDGKISELWASMDNLGMMQQLGVIPPMG
ncbi:MAG: ester cyclase [Cyclobacteriaceae bacterium]|nr:ester cyclase [Cyclobacteriaceae bacterium]MCK5467280.1 ester cyclase [Cyclobacteriaceae bacterium]